ncbi:unnamed protein product [Lactuca virosa]|uniref:DNA2/NAM7 helicase-like C-terminal domain-containing protein n=1 Tax=Lactuca virosa TaxID=75947 RepID=A0AAU9PV97_9ASTR|nr:unnamed protein product [Lactuca virosa]
MHRCYFGDNSSLANDIRKEMKQLSQRLLVGLLFSRVQDLYGDDVMSMLTVQYSMHGLIMTWSSKEPYNNKIKAHASAAGHTLYELEGVEKSSSSTKPTLLLIDIAGCDMEEKKDEEESTLNEGESEIVIAHARRLIQSGVHASDIGVITPY